jgi:hypothetical protein
MFDLSEICLRLLRALTAAPIAWLTPAQLASRIGGPRESAFDALADLDASGWLDPWEADGEFYVTLTPHAAERLGVRLVPAGRSDTLRWVPVNDPEPCPRAPGRGQGDVDALDLIPDPAPGPEAEVEAAERAERMVHRHPRGVHVASEPSLPRPTILLGSGLTPWPGPVEAKARICPGCLSGPIPERAYCLVCDRWGLDDILNGTGGPPASTSRPRRRTPNAPSDAALAAAKAARKEKHRRKLIEREAQERSRGSSVREARKA